MVFMLTQHEHALVLLLWGVCTPFSTHHLLRRCHQKRQIKSSLLTDCTILHIQFKRNNFFYSFYSDQRRNFKKSLWRRTLKKLASMVSFYWRWSDVWCERDSLIWYLKGWCVTPGNHWTAALLCHTHFNHLAIKQPLKSATWINVLSYIPSPVPFTCSLYLWCLNQCSWASEPA